jgi:hypothetical protein
MTQPGYQDGSEPMWWWKVALHLDEAQLALANAMAHNLDDQRPVFALQDRLREAQAILLEIFRAKGLLPGSTNGKGELPMPMQAAQGPSWPFPPGVPAPGVLPFPSTGGGHDAAFPTPSVDQSQQLVAEEPMGPEADQAAAVSGPEQSAVAVPRSEVSTPTLPVVVAPESAEAPTAPSVRGEGG